MKKIGIDARLYSQTGVGVYLQNLIYWLQKIAPKNLIFNIYLMEKDFNKVNINNKNFIKVKTDYHWHSFQEQVNYFNKLQTDQLDLMHFTYFSYPILYKKKFITTVHDLTPLLFKTGRASSKNQIIYSLKHLFFKIVLSSQIKNSRAIISPTQTVKNQIIKIYGEKYATKINSIYEGVNLNLLQRKENDNLKNSFKDFFIYVGNFYPHKNVEKLIKAFSQISSNHKLILLGPDDYFAKKIVRYIDISNTKNKIVLFNNPTLSDLVFFYKNAKALIHPSLSEGFGLPLVEAMCFNLPIIASNIPVFKEILDGKYLAFNPKDTQDIQRKIEYAIKNGLKTDYVDLLKKYSFARMAEQTLKVYLKNL